MENYVEEEAFEMIPCPSCGGGNEKESSSCSHCGKVLREERKKLFKRRSFFFGGIGLVLILAIGFFVTRISQSQAIGKVNGEVITREEFSKRVEQTKRLYENRYGENLFQGEEGKQHLTRLKAQILDEMVTEKILLQEAKNAGYTSAPPEEIEKELEAIRKKSGLSTADLEKMIGGKIQDVKAELGKEWSHFRICGKGRSKGQTENQILFSGSGLQKQRPQPELKPMKSWKPSRRQRLLAAPVDVAEVEKLNPSTRRLNRRQGPRV
jgi:predicted nucleic acid-binding Zn ribbon protein